MCVVCVSETSANGKRCRTTRKFSHRRRSESPTSAAAPFANAGMVQLCVAGRSGSCSSPSEHVGQAASLGRSARQRRLLCISRASCQSDCCRHTAAVSPRQRGQVRVLLALPDARCTIALSPIARSPSLRPYRSPLVAGDTWVVCVSASSVGPTVSRKKIP